MFRNYIRIMFRSMIKNKTYSVINTVGLAIGLGAFILIALFIQYEYSWDKFYPNHSRIYLIENYEDDLPKRDAHSQYPLAESLVREIPEVENAVRIRQVPGVFLSVDNDRTFNEPGCFYADPGVFQVFGIECIQGAPKTALQNPMSVVLTEGLADKYFPRENPIGKTIHLNNEYDLLVTAVIPNPPVNSHLSYSHFISFESHKTTMWDPTGDWHNHFLNTYLLIRENVSITKVAEKVSGIIRGKLNTEKYSVYLNPVSQIHREPIQVSLYLFMLFALFCLILACMNYMNLATAYSSVRSKEIGLRKVVGASRGSIIKQFVTESICFTFIAAILAVFLSEILLPIFNSIIQRDLSLDSFGNWICIALYGMLILIVGIISGSYPAFVTSSFHPAPILKGKFVPGVKSAFFRNGLVFMQFFITTCLIFGTVLFSRQFTFLKNKDLGFDKENILLSYIPSKDKINMEKFQALKNELLQNPSIHNVCVSDIAPFYGHNSMMLKRIADQQDLTYAVHNAIDYDYIDTYRMKIVSGRNFSQEFTSDKNNACIINETTAKALNLENPVGKDIYNNFNDRFTIIGVVKDFHSYTTFYDMAPCIMSLKSEIHGNVTYSIKIDPKNPKETVEFVTAKFKEFLPGNPVEFVFFAGNYDKIFFNIIGQICDVVRAFSILTILISCIGLFGLISFITNTRKKEIGIRKVLGAGVNQIWALFSGSFLKLLIITNVIALPLLYFLANILLQDFAYRIPLAPWMFILTGLIVLSTAMITVSLQVIRAAVANPVDSLRYE